MKEYINWLRGNFPLISWFSWFLYFPYISKTQKKKKSFNFSNVTEFTNISHVSSFDDSMDYWSRFFLYNKFAASINTKKAKDCRKKLFSASQWRFPCAFSFTRIFDYANTILLLASCHLNLKLELSSDAKRTTAQTSQTRKREIEEKKYCKLSEHDLIIYARYFNAISLPLSLCGSIVVLCSLISRKFK